MGAHADEAAFVEVLDQTEVYVQLREQLAAVLKQGAFALTRAKYTMGASALGSASYSSHMQASACVAVTDDDTKEGSMYSNFKLCMLTPPPSAPRPGRSSTSIDPRSTTINTSSVQTPSVGDHSSNGHAGEASTTAGVGNIVASGTASHTQPARSISSASDSSGSCAAVCRNATGSSAWRVDEADDKWDGQPVKDPLLWFGVLTPPALREAQAAFKTAVELCVQLAQASHRIQDGLDRLPGSQPEQ